MSPFPILTHIELSDAECEAVRKFFHFASTAGPDKSTPPMLRDHIEHMASVAGRITIEQDRMRRAREQEEHFRRGIP